MHKKAFTQIKTLIALSFALFLCCAAPAVQAQTKPISLALKNAPLEKAMSEIERQSPYRFVPNHEVDIAFRVTAAVKSGSIRTVLDALLKETPYTYSLLESTTTILLSKRAEVEFARVSGRVCDAAGQPIVGATVMVKGTTNGISTDAEGRFVLMVGTPAGAQLLISYLGYESQTLAVGSRTSFDVTLKESTSEIESVVVTALGIKRAEKALSYNVTEVKAEDITMVRDANFMNSLSGKVAGLQINSSSSGVGGAAKVTLRGQKSISQNNNALYVIDGIPMNNYGGARGTSTEFDSKGSTEAIADLNSDDIESISVLNGAAAAALYGSNAANGAIMITTKRGKAGKLNVSFSTNNEFLKPFVMPEFQNRYGTGLNGKRDGSPIQSWGPKLLPAAQTGYSPGDFFQTGYVSTNSVTLSGGTDKNQTFFSAATVNSEGIVPNNYYDRYNFTFRNTSYFLNDKLRLDVGASYIVQKDQNMTSQGVYSNPLVSAYLFPRGEDFSLAENFERYNPARGIYEQYWPYGEGGDLRMQNPYWIAYRNLRNNERNRYMLSASLSYDILSWLNVAGRVRVDNANNLYTQKLYASSNPTLLEGSDQGFYAEARRYDKQIYGDIMLNINKTFGENWSFNANVGASVNDTRTDELTYQGPIATSGIPNVFSVFDLDIEKRRASKYGWREQTQSVFASVEVGWKQLLYLTVTGRNDWASQLANSPESSFFYPSVGLSWIPSATFDLPEAITYLKVRGSFASVGIPFPRHLTVPTYEYDQTAHAWKPKTHYPIGELHPERTKTWELGVDLRLWKHLNLSASWYKADTYNQTFDPQISVSSGYSTIYLQTGHVRNTGVEATLGYDNRWRDFGWSSNFTFSWNKNRIIELVHNYVHPETGELISKDRLEIKGLGRAKYLLKPGGTMGDLYTNSSLKYSEKGYIELDDKGNVSTVDNLTTDIYLGSVLPDYNLAWRNDFSWKGVNLGFLISARIGGVCYSATQAWMDQFGVSEASAAARDAGGVVVNGRSTVNAQKWFQTISAQTGLPQYYTYSATNVRLQELSLGYTLPRRWFRDICSVQVSFVGRNLWMLYCKAPFDPEATAYTDNFYQGIDYFMMPSLRNIGFNVKLTF